jgi:hypothetical protein
LAGREAAHGVEHHQGVSGRFGSRDGLRPLAGPLAGLTPVTAGAGAQGFGCANPDELHVERRNNNEIVFPGCADFPNPLVRCPGH